MSNHTPVFRFVQFVKRIPSIYAIVLALVLAAAAAGIFAAVAVVAVAHNAVLMAYLYAVVAVVFLLMGINALRCELRTMAAPRIVPAEWSASEFPPVSLPGEDGKYVYIIQDADISHMVKIGRTRNLRTRIGRFMVVLPIRVHCIHYITCDDSFLAERALHEMFADKRGPGEWFRLTDLDIATLQSILHMGATCVVREPKP